MSIVTALRNYRVAAWVTGIGLLVLVFVAMPLKYVFGDPRLVGYVGMLHGFLYMAYIVCTLVLAERCRWRPFEALVILLAGTVPIASFVAERQVARRVQENRPVLGRDRSGVDVSTPHFASGSDQGRPAPDQG